MHEQLVVVRLRYSVDVPPCLIYVKRSLNILGLSEMSLEVRASSQLA